MNHFLSFRFSDWLLRRWGNVVDGRTKWGKLVNTDFSGPIGLTGRLNTKNDVIWSVDREDAQELLEFPEEKYGFNVMVWGGLCWKGLVPSNGPIFVPELKESCRAAGVQLGAKGGVTSAAYCHMLREMAAPEVHRIMGPRHLWQDDGARIHRTAAAKQTVAELFTERLDPDQQAAKMADCWSIENVWGILGQRVKERNPTPADLYTIIVEEWVRIDQDKELIKKLVKSMPKRFDAVRRLGGRQIYKADYEHE